MSPVRRAVCSVGSGVAALALVAGCGSPASSEDDGPQTLTVVASTTVWGSVASAVAGPDAEVRPIIADPAGDPHSYESTPADAAAITNADLVVANGGGYDAFVDQVADRDDAVRAKTIEAFALRPDQADDNEHVWFDPATVKAVAAQVADRLSASEPSRSAGLHQRAQAFTAQVDRVTQQTAAIGRARPGARVLATEPIAHYLLRTAGITDATPPPFVEAVENETEPSAASLVEVGDALSARQVSALVFNPQTETPVVAGLRDRAVAAGVPVVDVTETLPAGVSDYLPWVDGMRASLARAVGAPTQG